MSKLKQFYKDYLSIKPALWYLLGLSFVVVVWVDMDLTKIPELFPDGHKLQNLIYQLALGYIASLMFYYILVFPEEVKDRRVTEISSWLPNQNGHVIDPSTMRQLSMWARLRAFSFAWDATQDRIAQRMKTPDAEMRIKLTAIDQCLFLTMLRTFRGVQNPGENFLEVHAPQFWEYVELNRQLGEYCHKKYSTLPFQRYFLDPKENI